MDAASGFRTYTTDDIDALPEGVRAELIDRQIYYMAFPNTNHQRIVHFFDKTIDNYINRKNGDCEVFPAPFAVFLNNDKRNYVEPDISVICDRNKPDDEGCHGAPDWIVEIISLGNKSMDYFKKLFKYQATGVREYWIVDPTKELELYYKSDTY